MAGGLEELGDSSETRVRKCEAIEPSRRVIKEKKKVDFTEGRFKYYCHLEATESPALYFLGQQLGKEKETQVTDEKPWELM